METPNPDRYFELSHDDQRHHGNKSHDEGAFHLQLDPTAANRHEKISLLRPEQSHPPIANPGPLGLSAFALTTFVLSLYNAEAFDIKIHNAIVSLALFYGGAIQVLAGMWEFRANNIFGATAFSSYGAFWMALGYISVPASGIPDAYKGNTDQLTNAVGIFLLGWTIFTLMMLIATLKKTVAMVVLFGLLEITFLLLTIGKFASSTNSTKAGGWFGVATAFAAWYNAFATIVESDKELSAIISVPVGPLTRPKIAESSVLPK